jgi:menaquinone-9 beta-reductase
VTRRGPAASVDVAVVGGGPAGASIAAWLADRGRSVVVLERRPTYRWHACGVFSGPAVRPLLERLGIDPPLLTGMSRAIPAMRVETASGSTVRLTYGADGGGPGALAFDRARLDEALLDLAARRGADVRRGTSVGAIAVGPDGPTLEVSDADGTRTIGARVLVGADGIRSTVARAVGVARRPRVARVGLTFHLREEDPPAPRRLHPSAREPVPAAIDEPVDARMIVLGDAYCGLAPVPGGRVNVGLVGRGRVAEALRRDGPRAWADTILAAVPSSRPGAVHHAEEGAPIDRPEGAFPLGHRVVRRAGPDWLLVGDAAGFLDPFTGEGLHRALASAFLGAGAVDRHLAGDRDALPAYDRAMRGRFGAKDGVSLLVQAFLARPRLFEYAARRLERRQHVRETLALVLADMAPASRAFDARFLAALLAP